MAPAPDGTPPGLDELTARFNEAAEERILPRVFHQYLRDHAAVVMEWIETRLGDYLRARWASPDRSRWPLSLDAYRNLFPDHASEFGRVYLARRRDAAVGSPQLAAFELIGPGRRGGFGTVYRARHRALGLDRALKISHPEGPVWTDLSAAPVADAAYAVKFNGVPGFVTTHDVFLLNSGQVVVHMDYVSSPTLAEVIAAPGPINTRRACRIMVSLLEALGRVHAAGDVHNDLKPANVFVVGDTVLVSDFGSATRLNESGDQVTPSYAAPEKLIEYAVDVPNTIETDIYAVACIAFELFTRQKRHPNGHRRDELTVAPAGIPAALAAAIVRGLARDPRQRFHSAAEFAKPFQAYLVWWKWWLRLAIGGGVAAMCVAAGMWYQGFTHERTVAVQKNIHEVGNLFNSAACDIGQDQFALAKEKLDQAERQMPAGASEDLRAQLTRLRDALALVAELDAVRGRASTRIPEPVGNGGFDTASAPGGYRAALKAHGIDPEAGDPEEIAGRIKAAPAFAALVAALDDWAVHEPDAGTRARILSVVRRADPGSWLDRFRDPALRTDRAEVERLAAAVPADLAPGTVTALAELMQKHGLDPLPLLRREFVARPADFRLAFALWGLTSGDENLRCFRVAQAARPLSAPLLINRGVQHHKSNRTQWAVDELEKAIGIDPGNAVAHLHLGYCYLHHSHGSKVALALPAFRNAARLAPADARAHMGIASCLVFVPAEKRAAVDAAKLAVRLAPNDPDAHYTLARLEHHGLHENGDREAAIRSCRDALSRDPEHAGALCELGRILSYGNERDLREAIELLRKGWAHVERAPRKWPFVSRTWLEACEMRLGEKCP